jgi:hypothetical protein
MRRGPWIVGGVVAAGIAVVVVASATGDDVEGPSVVAGPTTTSIVIADEYVPDHSRFKFGQESVIVDGAIEPQQLEASIEEDVMITNATEATVTVEFINGGVGPDSDITETDIEPNESFVFREAYEHSIYFIVNGDESWAANMHVGYMRFGEEG